VRFALLVAVAAVALGGAGCASDAPAELASVTVAAPPPAPPPAQPVVKKPKVKLDCTRSRRVPGFRMCWRDSKKSYRASIERREGDAWRIVAFEPRGQLSYAPEAGRWFADGQWSELWLSPDGKTLLAQWSAECETSYAYFVPAKGGKPRSVTDGGGPNPMSFVVGWEADGRARVDVVGETGCSDGKWQPGQYLIDPATGDATFLHS
jgi:hypothetical protein